MINEEDHFGIQVMHGGLDLLSAWDQIDQLDNADRRLNCSTRFILVTVT